jgi:hypothetical protein
VRLKKSVKKISESYKASIGFIPLKDLLNIIYDKYFEYLDKVKCGDSECVGIHDSIIEIMCSVPVDKRKYFLGEILRSLLLWTLKNDESWYKKEKIKDLMGIVDEIVQFDRLRGYYNKIEKFKKTGDIRYLDMIQKNVKENMDDMTRDIKSNNDVIRILLDVLNGERNEIELYRSDEELEYLKDFKDLYNMFVENVYGEERIKPGIGDNEYIKALLMDSLSGLLFSKDDNLYFNLESETYQCIIKAVKEGV